MTQQIVLMHWIWNGPKIKIKIGGKKRWYHKNNKNFEWATELNAEKDLFGVNILVGYNKKFISKITCNTFEYDGVNASSLMHWFMNFASFLFVHPQEMKSHPSHGYVGEDILLLKDIHIRKSIIRDH